MPPLQPLQISSADRGGGAAIAAARLHHALRGIGHESQMLVLKKSGHDPHTRMITLPRLAGFIRRRRLPAERPSKRQYPNYDGRTWTVGRVSMPLAAYARALTPPPDVIHLHWVGAGMLSVQEIARFKRPVLWTLHDMWAFTGGCHYAAACTRYREACGRCPALGSTREHDLSRDTFNAKRRAWREIPFTLVTPSRWLADRVRESALLGDQRVEVIPNGLDTTVFKPVDRGFARQVFNLPVDKKLVLFAAMHWTDRYKGYHHLLAALEHLRGRDDLALVTVGSGDSTPLQAFGLPVYHTGIISDERLMALLYAAADVFVAPSEQDNLPNTVIESLACGTPCVAFHIGGMPDLIDSQETGYLAAPFDAADLAHGIVWVLEDKARLQALSKEARHRAVSRYDAPLIAERYAALYKELSRQGQA